MRTVPAETGNGTVTFVGMFVEKILLASVHRHLSNIDCLLPALFTLVVL
jgi:hypothetical protein